MSANSTVSSAAIVTDQKAVKVKGPENIFSYRSYRWLWVNLIVLAGLTYYYIQDKPIGGRNGGTFVGYTYGIIATLGILYLTWFGMRKRSYRARFTTLQGCLAAHVWLGISLSIIVPLHSGFSFGLNVHTLAYALMMIVVVSGIYGAVQYVNKPHEIQSHRGGATLAKLVEEEAGLAKEIKDLFINHSDRFVKLAQSLLIPLPKGYWKIIKAKFPAMLSPEQIAQQVNKLPEAEQEIGLELVALANRRIELLKKIQTELIVAKKLKLWLFFHVPVTFMLLSVLTVHIVSVLYFR